MIAVTKPFLPPIEEYQKYLVGVWQRQWLTNMGPLASDLEIKLKEYLDLKHLLFVTNGTIALQMAIKALNLEGEIITTPFSFVATTSCIVWENCTPVFVDIEKNSLNIDPSKIETKITNKTTAILATHVYGNPCNVVAIEKIAQKHNLKVIYDAAHAFGVKVDGKSIFDYGDVSTCSLHATKLFHSGEGGLVIAKDGALIKKLAHIRNFGISGFDTFSELGINGKNSELHAAMGLANLKYISEIHNKRKQIFDRYLEKLHDFQATIPVWHDRSTNNYSYFPLIFKSEDLMLKCIDVLTLNEIGTRRYFYPSLASALPYIEPSAMEVTDDIAKRVLCLPFYYDLTLEEVDHICRILLRVQNN